MKIVTIIVRILLGLVFVVFGSNAFLHFQPIPPMAGWPGQFIGSMAESGYMQGVAVFQIAGGLLLVIGRYVPLGLALLGPIVENIVLFHLFMDHSGLGVAAVVSLLWLFLLWRYR